MGYKGRMADAETKSLREVRLEPGTVVIGDLHLDVSPHGGDHRAFSSWLETLAGVPRLVILGDLFDAWVGPAHARLPAAHAVCSALRARVDAGCAVEVLHGNRDFLLDESFERDTGARVHPHGFVAVLAGGRRVLFVHGDELCTLDHSYQRLKRVVRSGGVRWLAPRLPDALALWTAKRLRSRSQSAVAAKPAAEKEQQETEVERLIRLHACEGLVCGHAHRFRAAPIASGHGWWVLDAFGEGQDVLTVSGPGDLIPSCSRVPGADGPADPVPRATPGGPGNGARA